MGRINVCIACDDNYAKYAAVVMASILKNAKEEDNLHFFILDSGVNQDTKTKTYKLKSIKNCEINFIDIDEELFNDYKNVKTHGYISLPAFYRLKLASLLPHIDKIIYFDCDMVINSSLDELFNIDLGGHPIGGVSDIKKRMVKKNPTYVNSGMLVMDLKKFREDNIEQKLLDWTREHFDEIKVGDQQIINETLIGDIQLLPATWNVQSSNFTNRSSYVKRPNIIHYVGNQKPWKPASWNYFKNLFREYRQLTEWKVDDTPEEIRNDDFQGMLGYIKYRPLFFLRPRFYQALWFTYIWQKWTLAKSVSL